MNKIHLSNDELHEILRLCFNPTSSEHSNLTLGDLPSLIKQIWIVLAQNKCGTTNNWFLHCKAAIAGIYYFHDEKDEICATLRSLCSLDCNTETVNLPILDLKLTIRALSTFKLSVLYGLLYLAAAQKELVYDDFRFLFGNIIDQCQQQSRHNHIYFQLLEVCVRNFQHFLTEEDSNYVFHTIYYNLDKKECCLLLRYIFNKTDNIQASDILERALNSMSWKYKQKYILINEVLSNFHTFIDKIPHEECIKGLIYAQSRSYLTVVGTKLYNTIIKSVDAELWWHVYFPALEEVILNQDTPGFTLRNIIKNYFNFEHIPRSYFDDVFKKIRTFGKLTTIAILSLAVTGIRKGLFSKDYIFEDIIDLGWTNADDHIRALSFDIACSVYHVDNLETYEAIQEFIIFNLNGADQSNRESIKKSFKRFLNKIENKIFSMKTLKRTDPFVKYSTDFFKWLLPFLFKQCGCASNYQRISLSIILMHITMTEFSKYKPIKCCKNIRLYEEFLSKVAGLNNFNIYLPNLVETLKVCDSEQAEIIINIMLTEIDYTRISHEQIDAIELLGYEYIHNCNREIAESGRNLLEFVGKVKMNDKLEKSLNIKVFVFEQWKQIKESRSTDVVLQNPLHPLISLMSSYVNYCRHAAFEELLNFVEDIVFNLLNVFGIRGMIPFDFGGDCCIGIALAFKEEESEYHQCTVNCMWLALKACCKLLTLIVKRTKVAGFMRRTLNLLQSVILKCFHKGALEEAGNAISVIVHSATSHNYCVYVIEEFLEEIFETIPETTEAISTVRRAAETRVVLSSIAVNDRRLHKPFFHQTINFLIKTLDSCLLDENSEKNAVHCLALHCLQPIIINNSVELHAAEYLSTIAIISLNSFNKTDWRIRNAALQTFGAVSNKLLGTVESGDDDEIRQHVICLEEVLFKHPAIYVYIEARLIEALDSPKEFTNIVVPIFSFISMSYRRHDMLVDTIEKKMDRFLDCLLRYMDIAPNLYIFKLAAKAYTASCCHDSIPLEIQRFGDKLCETVDNNIYFSLLDVLKVLSDKLIDDASSLPNCDNIEFDVLEQIAAILKRTSERNTLHKVMCGIHLFRPGLKLIGPNNMKNNLLFLIENQNTVTTLPGIWRCVENKLKLIFNYEKQIIKIELIEFCLSENVPINIKSFCLQFVKNLVEKNEQEKAFYSQKLKNLLVDIILGDNKISDCLVDEYTNLILLLNSDLNINNITKVLNNIENIQKGIVPKNYLPIICRVCENTDEKLAKIKNFFEWCAKLYSSELEHENPDISIIKSIKFTFNFGSRTKNRNILVKTLIAIYRMLQIDNDEVKQESSSIIAYCFKLEPSYSYRNMINLLDADNLVRVAGPPSAIYFLMSVYLERNVILQSINVFERRTTLLIETDIVEEHIIQAISSIFKNNLQYQNEIKNWFLNFNYNVSNRYYAEVVKQILL